MIDDTALWAWFVFDSGLPTQRAKVLLEAWQAEGLSLAAALDRVQAQAMRLGLTTGEAQLLESGRAALRATPAPPPALTWRDELYPRGLRSLSLRVRPALLFYEGNPSHLTRPIIYLAPGPVSADREELVREVLSLLLGEDIVVGMFDSTPQAALAVEEAMAAEGELLIFARAGLAQRMVLESERNLVASGRALLLSPLPPKIPYQPGLEAVLHQIAWYASERVILSADSASPAPPGDWLMSRPVLQLQSTPGRQSHLAGCTTATEPSDVLDWLEDRVTPGPLPGIAHEALQRPSSPASTPIAEDDGALADAAPLPPLSPEEILQTLGKGGTIPDVLRRKILKGS